MDLTPNRIEPSLLIPPVNLARCSHLLGSASNRPYDLYFVNSALNGVRDREADGLIPKGRYPLSNLMTLRGFDDVYIAPQAASTMGETTMIVAVQVRTFQQSPRRQSLSIPKTIPSLTLWI